MKQSFTRFYADSTCPYTIHGVHLTSLRRTKLLPIAEALGIDANPLPKNEMIKAMMGVLSASDAPKELSELAKVAEAEAPAKDEAPEVPAEAESSE